MVTYISNYSTDLLCITSGTNTNSSYGSTMTCTGKIAVIPYNSDITTVLLVIITVCVVILTVKKLSEVILK